MKLRPFCFRMRAFIADNPPGKHGIHEYAPEAFGIVPEQVRGAFHEYIGHFGLEPETVASA